MHSLYHQSIISEAARVPLEGDEEERWLDPRSKTTFSFNHLTLVRPQTVGEPRRLAHSELPGCEQLPALRAQ